MSEKQRRPRVLVVSPGVLPLPPTLGGAVENMIAQLHSGVETLAQMEYVAVRPPSRPKKDNRMAGATFHYIESIDPLKDFSVDNHFELHESARWGEYKEFCRQVVVDRSPNILHIHNEAHLAASLRRVAPAARVIVHINDEVVTRMSEIELQEFGKAVDLVLACSDYIRREVARAFRVGKLRHLRWKCSTTLWTRMNSFREIAWLPMCRT